MSQVKGKPPHIAKGKARSFYVLQERLVKRVARMAINEGTRASYVAERLILKGLEAEAKEANSPSDN